MHVRDDGRLIGSTGPGGYLCWERNAGDAVISCQTESKSEIKLEVRSGTVYYILQRIRMGVGIARNRLEIVGNEEAQNILKKCHPPR